MGLWRLLLCSFSLDGGSHWSPNRRISDGFDTTVGYPVQEKIGDYDQVVSDSGGVNIVYAATFNGGQDLYFLRATPLVLRVTPLIPGERQSFPFPARHRTSESGSHSA